MKLTIVLEKKSRFNIELSEDGASRLYSDLVSLAVGLPLRAIINITGIENQESPAEKQHVIEEKMEQVASDLKEEVKYPKRLVLTKCPHCDRLAAMVLYIKDNQVEHSTSPLTCRHCGGGIPVEELKPASYTCPNCDHHTEFYAMGELKDVECKICSSPIDLIWVEHKKRYVSANLVGGKKDEEV